MKPAQVGTEHRLFFDSYALFAIAQGSESYRAYAKGVQAVTTLMNLYEVYYLLLQESLYTEAEKIFDRFLPCCVPLAPTWIKDAAAFRLRHRKLKLSYVNCLGYVIAQDRRIRFLTGDRGFRELPGVLFVH